MCGEVKPHFLCLIPKEGPGHKAEIYWSLGSWGAQPQWMHLRHSSCIYCSGSMAEEGLNDCESQNTRKSAVRQSLLSTDMPMWKGNFLKNRILPLDWTTDNYWLLGKRELTSPRDELPYRLSRAEWSTLKPFTQTIKITSAGCVYLIVYLHTCVYACMYVPVIMTVREAINLGVDGDMWGTGKKGTWKGWKEKREGESDIILIQLKMYKN